MKKKGQGLSMNTIIIAALGLAVLVVLFAVFTGRIGIFSQGVADADTCLQKCQSIGKNFDGSFVFGQQCRAPNNFIAGSYSDLPVNNEGQQGACCCT